MGKQYIKHSNQAPNLGISSALIWLIAIDHYNWPQWAYGAWGVFFGLVLIGSIYRIFTEDGVDVVERKP